MGVTVDAITFRPLDSYVKKTVPSETKTRAKTFPGNMLNDSYKTLNG